MAVNFSKMPNWFLLNIHLYFWPRKHAINKYIVTAVKSCVSCRFFMTIKIIKLEWSLIQWKGSAVLHCYMLKRLKEGLKADWRVFHSTHTHSRASPAVLKRGFKQKKFLHSFSLFSCTQLFFGRQSHYGLEPVILFQAQVLEPPCLVQACYEDTFLGPSSVPGFVLGSEHVMQEKADIRDAKGSSIVQERQRLQEWRKQWVIACGQGRLDHGTDSTPCQNSTLCGVTPTSFLHLVFWLTQLLLTTSCGSLVPWKSCSSQPVSSLRS
jgi:hypothetical protein